MARYAIIENGLVVNVAVGDPEWAASVGAVQNDTAEIGWTFSDGVFSPPPSPPIAPTFREPPSIFSDPSISDLLKGA